MITEKTLRDDAMDGLEEFYKEERELLEQINTFEEALESARSDLGVLRRQWKSKFKQAGVKYSVSELIVKFLKECEPIHRSDFANRYGTRLGLAYTQIFSKLALLSDINRITATEDGIIALNKDWKTVRTGRNGAKEVVLDILRKATEPLTVEEVFKRSSIKKNTVRSTLIYLERLNKVVASKNRSHSTPNTYAYREPVPKKESEKCESMAIQSTTSSLASL